MDICFIGLALTQDCWFLPQMITFHCFFPEKCYIPSVNHDMYAVEILLYFSAEYLMY